MQKFIYFLLQNTCGKNLFCFCTDFQINHKIEKGKENHDSKGKLILKQKAFYSILEKSEQVYLDIKKNWIILNQLIVNEIFIKNYNIEIWNYTKLYLFRA